MSNHLACLSFGESKFPRGIFIERKGSEEKAEGRIQLCNSKCVLFLYIKDPIVQGSKDIYSNDLLRRLRFLLMYLN